MNSDGVIRVSSVALRCVRRPFWLYAASQPRPRPAGLLFASCRPRRRARRFVRERDQYASCASFRAGLISLPGLSCAACIIAHWCLTARKHTPQDPAIEPCPLEKKRARVSPQRPSTVTALPTCTEHYWWPRTPSPRPLHARRLRSMSAPVLCNRNSCTESLDESRRGACPHP